jgi:type IV/VI secretion system ImpK/VasF family protein
MQDEVADLVYPVIKLGLDLKDRLERGESEDLAKAQSEFKRLLSDKRWNEAGDSGPQEASMMQSAASLRPSGSGRFLGMRYGLVCWLDEIFVLDAQWGPEWNEHSLERAIYGSRDRADLFWEQSERAEVRPGSDAIEVYYLCVMLGFRGIYRDQPERLRAWIDKVRPQIIRGYGQEPPQLDNSTPVNDVPLLTGRERFQTMFVVWGRVLLLLLFVVAFFVVFFLARQS